MLKIGFHTGPGGNAQGITQNYWAKLNAAGKPCFQKGVDDYGACGEVAELGREHGVKNVIAFRMSGWRDSQVYRGRYNLDVPLYDRDPESAALIHWEVTREFLPSEFHKEDVWLEVINEVDKNRSDWLGRFGVEIAKLAISEGYKIALFGFSSGEPEPHHWYTAGMVDFLKFAADHHEQVAVALHEYSFSYDIWNGMNLVYDDVFDYSKVGRFTKLFHACDDLDIKRPYVLITEWGWHATTLPDADTAIHQIRNVGEFYEMHPEVLGANLWYLGGGYNNIANLAQKLIEPVGQLAYDWVEYTEPPGPGLHKAIVVKSPQEVTKEEWLQIADYSYDFRHTMTASEDDMVTVIDGGNLDSYVKVFEPDRPSQVRSINTLESLGINWEPHYLVEKIAFEFTELPTEYPVVTQAFGDNPDYYGQFGLPGHEGVDLRAPAGSKIFAVADGVVVEAQVDDGHNYGTRVRIDHEDGYQTTYAHLSKLLVAQGDIVYAGEIIGLAGSTGNSTAAHLHLTLKSVRANEGGSEYIGYPYNIIDPTPYLQPLLDGAEPPVEGPRYDLASYMVTGDNLGPLYEVQTEGAGQERHQTQVEGTIFYHTKGGDGPAIPANWEELMFDSEFIYRFTDVSMNESQYYQLRDVADQPWSKWGKRFMAIGEKYERNPIVSVYMKDGCVNVSNDRVPSLLTLTGVHTEYTFFTGVKLANVIELLWTDMAGNAIEKYYYARGYGLVGWEGSHGERAAISEIHGPGSRPNNVRKVIDCL